MDLAPSGEQFEIAAGGYRAVVTESGAALRLLSHDGRDLIDGFSETEMSPGGRGQLLMPWPNRIRDGKYSFGGRDLQLPLTEPKRSNASHGLARWATWQCAEHEDASVLMRLRVQAQIGYPWTLDLSAAYHLGPDGLTVTQRAVNRSGEPAPYACGAHPYLLAGPGPVDGWELTLPVTTRLLVDDRMLPVGEEAVAGTAHDFTQPRVIGSMGFDDAYGGLVEAGGRVAVTVRNVENGEGTEIWGEGVRWWQVFSADEVPQTARRSLAVEPMSAPADAFNSGRDLAVLEPGASHEMRWGVRAL